MYAHTYMHTHTPCMVQCSADFMDNYLNMQDSEATDLHYATTTVYAEHKKETI